MCRATRRASSRHYDSAGDAYPDTVEVMRKLIPTHVVFNGRAGALTGKNALTSKVGEQVLVVHSQANRDTPPASDRRPRRLRLGDGQVRQPAGKGSGDLVHPRRLGGCCALHLRAAGHLRLCHHNLIEAVELGATAHFKVEGTWNNDLMKQVSPPGPIGGGDKLGALEAAPMVHTH